MFSVAQPANRNRKINLVVLTVGLKKAQGFEFLRLELKVSILFSFSFINLKQSVDLERGASFITTGSPLSGVGLFPLSKQRRRAMSSTGKWFRRMCAVVIVVDTKRKCFILVSLYSSWQSHGISLNVGFSIIWKFYCYSITFRKTNRYVFYFLECPFMLKLSLFQMRP